MFEYYGNIHVYCPGVRADEPWGPLFFKIINLQSYFPFPARCFLQMTIQQLSPIKCIGHLSWPCRKIGQGHPRVMIYIHIVELESLMLHTEFQDPKSYDHGEENF